MLMRCRLMPIRMEIGINPSAIDLSLRAKNFTELVCLILPIGFDFVCLLLGRGGGI